MDRKKERGKSYTFMSKQLLSDAFFTLLSESSSWQRLRKQQLGSHIIFFKWGNSLKEMYHVHSQIMSETGQKENPILGTSAVLLWVSAVNSAPLGLLWGLCIDASHCCPSLPPWWLGMFIFTSRVNILLWQFTCKLQMQDTVQFQYLPWFLCMGP